MNKEKLLRIIFPEVCPVCGDVLTDKNRCKGNPYICKYCYSTLSFAKGRRCLKCAKSVDDETKVICGECERKERFFDRGFALLTHDEAAKKIIYGFKFDYNLDNLRFPALEAALRIGRVINHLGVEAFIPVPLHKSRLRERGYNQAELLTEEIVRFMELLYGISPVCDSTYLIRKKKTKYQRDLDHKYREENVKNAFCVNPESAGVYKRVCIVDDIYTTGSTINSCAKALKAAGCTNVYFFAVSTVG